MSLHLQPFEAIPELTRRLATASFPKGTLAINLRDALGPLYDDHAFAYLFPKRGRGASAPWQLALITVLQAAENLSDQQAAEMVRGRIDWKYALSLPADDAGFDASILTDFRQRLVEHNAADLLLEPILAVCRERGWLSNGGKQRVDSTMVLSKARRLSSVETVGETIRALLNQMAEVEPDWLLGQIKMDWFDRYVHRFDLQRFPKSKRAQEQMQQQVGEDGWVLLHLMQDEGTPATVRACSMARVLEQVWNQHYERKEGKVRWRDGPAQKNRDRIISPYDQESRESRKRETEWFGRKVHLTETCGEETEVHVIIDVKTVPATQPDAQETLALLTRLQEQDMLAEAMCMDMGYTSGKVLQWGKEHGVEIIGPVQQDTNWQQKTGYGVEVFEIDWERKVAVCPQGEESQFWRSRGVRGTHIYFNAGTCQGCRMKEKCTKSEVGGRTLTLSTQQKHELVQKRRVEQYEKDFQEKYGMRAGVEGTIAGCVARNWRKIKWGRRSSNCCV